MGKKHKKNSSELPCGSSCLKGMGYHFKKYGIGSDFRRNLCRYCEHNPKRKELKQRDRS